MAKTVGQLSISEEDYLEAALRLTIDGQRIKVTKVAELLNVSKPAATNGLNELAAKGLMTKEPYGDIFLTEKGKAEAELVYEKHRLLNGFLQKLGVSAQVAEVDCCKIEHILSDETVEAIKKFMGK